MNVYRIYENFKIHKFFQFHEPFFFQIHALFWNPQLFSNPRAFFKSVKVFQICELFHKLFSNPWPILIIIIFFKYMKFLNSWNFPKTRTFFKIRTKLLNAQTFLKCVKIFRPTNIFFYKLANIFKSILFLESQPVNHQIGPRILAGWEWASCSNRGLPMREGRVSANLFNWLKERRLGPLLLIDVSGAERVVGARYIHSWAKPQKCYIPRPLARQGYW